MMPLPHNAAMPISQQLGSLCKSSLVVVPDEPTQRLEGRFQHQPGLPVAVVVTDGRPIGIIERNYLFELFAQPFGRALNARKPVVDIMQTAIVLPGSTPLLEAGRHLIEIGAENDELPHSLVIIDADNHYLGLVRVRELLRSITELRIQQAREANPLTGLPGNATLARHIDAHLAAQNLIHVAYVDCNHFKPYNDTYGYAAGDSVIHAIGRLLVAHADPQDMVAHIGGDDFMVIFTSNDWQQRCEALLRDFREQAAHFYSPEHVQQGHFLGRDRQGQPCRHALLSLAIGVCCPDPVYCPSHLEVSALAAEAKKEAKRIGGNVIYATRRRKPNSWYGGEVEAS